MTCNIDECPFKDTINEVVLQQKELVKEIKLIREKLAKWSYIALTLLGLLLGSSPQAVEILSKMLK